MGCRLYKKRDIFVLASMTLLQCDQRCNKKAVVHVACSLPNLWPGGQKRSILGDGGFTAFPWKSLYDHCIGWQCSSTKERTLALPRTRTHPLTASSQRSNGRACSSRYPANTRGSGRSPYPRMRFHIYLGWFGPSVDG